MATRTQTEPRFVVCVNNDGYAASLELHKIYKVIPDPDIELDGDIRVVDESGEDYIFSANRFIPIKVPAAVKVSMTHPVSETRSLTSRHKCR